MARNRALQVLQDLVAQREREVIEAACTWYEIDKDLAEDHPIGNAVIQLRDARALLAKATEPTTQPQATPC